jgi:hypothetical protein
MLYMYALLYSLRTSTNTAALGHYRLWINGIHHGDISLNNLMYSTLPTGKPEGVLNDYDLASWDKCRTTNSDRTGTIPFMALSMLDGGLDEQIPRLYRHDAESFVWVLTYITLVTVKYKGRYALIFRPPVLDPWFEGAHGDHHRTKLAFPNIYSIRCQVSQGHEQYSVVVRQLIDYWVKFDNALAQSKNSGRLIGPEIDDPKCALEDLINGAEMLGAGAENEFAGPRARLWEAIGTPEVA